MNTPILNVRGIGPAAATLLAENGISSAEQLAQQKVGTLAAIKGFSETRARQVIADATALFTTSTAIETQEPAAEKEQRAEKQKTDKKSAAKKAAKKRKKKSSSQKTKKKKKGKKGKKKK
jgi:transcription termination factor NusA